MTRPRVVHLVPSLGCNGIAKQLSLVLPRLDVEQTVVAFGAFEPFGPMLEAANVRVVRERWRSVANVVRFVRAAKPDVVHAWGTRAARLLPLFAGRRLVSSHETGGWWTRRLARGAEPLAVSPVVEPLRERVDLRSLFGLPARAKVVVCVASAATTHELHDAVWAFDIAKYPLADLHLVLVGEGARRERLRHFARSLAHDDLRVHFAGTRADVPALYAGADLAWCLARQGGTHRVLEAMAAGACVVAMRNPAVASIVRDGETGRLVAHADRVALASLTQRLLAPSGEAARLAEAGRAHAAANFAVEPMVERLRAAYHDAAAPRP